MSQRRRHRRLPLDRTSAVGVVMLGAALMFGGCDLMTAQGTLRPSRLVATPEPPPETAPPASDEAPTVRPEPPGDVLSMADAANALADLSSYRVAVATRGLIPAAAPAGQVTMTSTLIQGAEPAAEFTLAGVDGLAGGRLDAVVIGDQAWLRTGGGSWRKSPGGAADFDAAFTTLSPIDLVTRFDGLSAAVVEIGRERKDGQPATHYRSEDGNRLAIQAGLSRGTTDLWLAVDDRHLVAFALDGAWDADGTLTPMTLTIDVSHVDDPANAVEAPAG